MPQRILCERLGNTNSLFEVQLKKYRDERNYKRRIPCGHRRYREGHRCGIRNAADQQPHWALHRCGAACGERTLSFAGSGNGRPGDRTHRILPCDDVGRFAQLVRPGAGVRPAWIPASRHRQRTDTGRAVPFAAPGSCRMPPCGSSGILPAFRVPECAGTCYTGSPERGLFCPFIWWPISAGHCSVPQFLSSKWLMTGLQNKWCS